MLGHRAIRRWFYAKAVVGSLAGVASSDCCWVRQCRLGVVESTSLDVGQAESALLRATDFAYSLMQGSENSGLIISGLGLIPSTSWC